MIETLNNSTLCWKDTAIGRIKNVNYDLPHFYGDFVPLAGVDHFRQLFAFIMDENAVGNPPFDDDLLDDDNWWLVTPDGKRTGILIPAVDLNDGTIDWRNR